MRARTHVRRVVRASGFGAITAVLLPPYLAHRRVTREGAEREAVRDAWVRRWADALLALFGIDVDVTGAHGFAPGQGRLVVANHRSAIDIAILLRTFGGHMVSRADIAGWPLLGLAARSVDTIFVDRANSASGAQTIRAIRDALVAGGTVCVFPEGTTFDGDEVHPFHAGAFLGALKTGAAIVPVGLAYARGSGAAFVQESFLSHLGRMAAADPSRVTAVVGAPIAIERASRAADLATRSRDAVRGLVTQARARVDSAG